MLPHNARMLFWCDDIQRSASRCPSSTGAQPSIFETSSSLRSCCPVLRSGSAGLSRIKRLSPTIKRSITPAEHWRLARPLLSHSSLISPNEHEDVLRALGTPTLRLPKCHKPICEYPNSPSRLHDRRLEGALLIDAARPRGWSNRTRSQIRARALST